MRLRSFSALLGALCVSDIDAAGSDNSLTGKSGAREADMSVRAGP